VRRGRFEELRASNEELSGVNSDLMNLLNNVQIAIVIIGSDMRIRRFTPMAEKILNLMQGDVGRPISHINPNINCPDLEKLVAEVVDTFNPVDLEVRDRLGTWFTLRVRPYKNAEKRIDGAVLILFDIDAVKKQQVQLGQSSGVTDILLTIDKPTVVLDSELRVKNANQTFCELFGVSRKELQGHSIYDLNKGEWNSPALHNMIDEILPKEGHFEGFAHDTELPGRGHIRMVVTARRVEGGTEDQRWCVLSVSPIKDGASEEDAS